MSVNERSGWGSLIERLLAVSIDNRVRRLRAAARVFPRDIHPLRGQPYFGAGNDNGREAITFHWPFLF